MDHSHTVSPSLGRYLSHRAKQRETRKRPGRFAALLAVVASLSAAATAPAHAAETINYTYDAKGRLVGVARSGGPANGLQTSYEYDAADNRKTVSTIGQITPSAAVLVIRLKDFTVVIPQ